MNKRILERWKYTNIYHIQIISVLTVYDPITTLIVYSHRSRHVLFEPGFSF